MTGTNSQFERGDRRKGERFPTLTVLSGPGIPAESAIKRIPYIVYELEGELHTNHKSTRLKRRAAKDKQATIAMANTLVNYGCLQQDGGLASVRKEGSHDTLAGGFGYKSRESVSRLQRKVMRSIIKVERRKRSNSYTWNIPQKSNRTYDAAHIQLASAADAIKQKPELARLLRTTFQGELPARPGDRATFRNPAQQYRSNGVRVHVRQRTVRLQQVRRDMEFGKGADYAGSDCGEVRTASRYGARFSAQDLRRMTDRQGGKHKGLGILKIIGKPGQWMLNGKPVTTKVPGCVWVQQEPNEYVGVANWVETEDSATIGPWSRSALVANSGRPSWIRSISTRAWSGWRSGGQHKDLPRRVPATHAGSKGIA